MKTSVKNLDELVQQSEINFSLMRNSTIKGYFLNLAKAEDDIYMAWKGISLNSKKYSYSQVWNYPVKQKFQQLLEAIEGAGTNGLFAFIHDVNNVRYQFYSNCSYSSISETFGERSLAKAIRPRSTL
ncbi:GRIN [Lepeophtheirus salmonis]|uniref:GRIN n=1 Tax=Lepeophtheirus salmonis TaxID=72036 RepID=A0A7R8CHB8_LEPSM|nr:GRIN [Lepeophtheirus salmonis]CAF2818921.1 GRIN [Lepeophtheirus salmonis]